MGKKYDKKFEEKYRSRLEKIDLHLKALEEKEDYINNYAFHADSAMNQLSFILLSMTGNSFRDVTEAYLKHCGKARCKLKYPRSKKLAYCDIITILVNRGSPKSQAVSLVAKTRNNSKISVSGFEKEMKKSLSAYKNKAENNPKDITFPESFILESYIIKALLKEMRDNADFEELDKECPKASKAFKSVLEEVEKHHTPLDAF
ncbi:MAG: hypothetical protein AB7U85_10195 [Alphaproteobacteria bacterium]